MHHFSTYDIKGLPECEKNLHAVASASLHLSSDSGRPLHHGCWANRSGGRPFFWCRHMNPAFVMKWFFQLPTVTRNAVWCVISDTKSFVPLIIYDCGVCVLTCASTWVFMFLPSFTCCAMLLYIYLRLIATLFSQLVSNRTTFTQLSANWHLFAAGNAVLHREVFYSTQQHMWLSMRCVYYDGLYLFFTSFQVLLIKPLYLLYCGIHSLACAFWLHLRSVLLFLSRCAFSPSRPLYLLIVQSLLPLHSHLF